MTHTLRTVTTTYRAGNAYFICDRCSQRWRRSSMLVEWDNLRVCPVCIDPRPPQMTPPDVYPEGIPFVDARSPQDNPDRLSDDSYLSPVVGGVTAPYGGPALQPNGQTMPDGGLAPREFVEDPLPYIENELVGDTLSAVYADGGELVVVGGVSPPSPLPDIPTIPGQAVPNGSNVLQDDITFKTGVIPAPTVSGAG